jgi:hypothetical protein
VDQRQEEFPQIFVFRYWVSLVTNRGAISEVASRTSVQIGYAKDDYSRHDHLRFFLTLTCQQMPHHAHSTRVAVCASILLWFLHSLVISCYFSDNSTGSIANMAQLTSLPAQIMKEIILLMFPNDQSNDADFSNPQAAQLAEWKTTTLCHSRKRFLRPHEEMV